MSEEPPPEAGPDAAWVSVATTLSLAGLLALLRDPERLMRVNAQWVFESWESLGTERCRFRIYNQSNGQRWETEANIRHLPDGVSLDYREGIKAATRLRVEPVAGGTLLWIIDDYGRLPEAERKQRLAEVDPSLSQWGRDLYRHLRAWSRWSRLAPWRWFIERIWLRMKPSSRRLMRILGWISLAELALFGLLVAILVAERTR